MALTAEQKRLEIRKRFHKDFEFYANRLLYIRTKKAEVIPFRLNRAQKRFLDIILDQWQRTGRVRVYVLKARQLGLSTLWGGFMYWWTSTHRATKAMVVTHHSDATKALFEMTKRYHEHMTPLMKPSTGRSSQKELKFDKLDSGYIVATAGADTVGRGETLNLVHISEAGLWKPKTASDIANGLLQAVPGEDNTFVCIESTARGKSGWFYEQYVQIKNGTSPYELVFLPWFFSDEYREKIPPEELPFEWTHEEEEMAARVKKEWDEDLDDEQIYWRRLKLSEGLDRFKQEYPSTAEEAFLASGLPVFNPYVVQEMEEAAKEIEPILMDYDPIEKAIVQRPRGRLKVYSLPEPNENYIIGADVAKGVGREEIRDADGVVIQAGEGDYSVATVLDSKRNVVAVYRGKVEPGYYAEILNALGEMYNWARLAVELNNHGILPNRFLRDNFDYPNLYSRENYDKLDDARPTEDLGFYTDVKTRPLIIDSLREAVRNKEIEIPDLVTLQEMSTFIENIKTGKLEAESGSYDDCVMALAIANHIYQEEAAWIPSDTPQDLYYEMI
jgi:hypothetical protein